MGEPRRGCAQFHSRSFSKEGDQAIGIFYRKLLKQPTVLTIFQSNGFVAFLGMALTVHPLVVALPLLFTTPCNNSIKDTRGTNKKEQYRYMMKSNKEVKRASRVCLETVLRIVLCSSELKTVIILKKYIWKTFDRKLFFLFVLKMECLLEQI